MKKLIAVVLIVGGVLLLSITCPDKRAHQEAIREMVSQVYNAKVNEDIGEEDAKNGLVQGFALLGNMFVDRVMESVLETKLSVKNYVLFSVGTINHEGKDNVVSFGILNNVFTCDKKDVKRIINGD